MSIKLSGGDGMLEGGDYYIGPAWKPIATAPKDGSLFLVWDRELEDYDIYLWFDEHKRWSTWFSHMDLYVDSDAVWMPLPEPPNV